MAHLAGKLIENIRRKQGDKLDIDDRDILCVKIAGLCHDLGIFKSSLCTKVFHGLFKVMAHFLTYGIIVFLKGIGRYVYFGNLNIIFKAMNYSIAKRRV